MATNKSIPSSWSALTWQELCHTWEMKMRYGGNADVARVAVLLALCRCTVSNLAEDDRTGETVCTFCAEDGSWYLATPRELAQMASQSLSWLDYPYGDPGEPAVEDEEGHIVKEARPPHRGYVSPMLDAMILPEAEVTVGGVCFALPQAACSNLTWQQYRSLQTTAQQLFQDGIDDGQALELQAQFLAHCLVPEQEGQPANPSDRFRPKHVFHYDVDRAEQTVTFWQAQMAAAPTLFHICFQCYQTAVAYYAITYPLLFSGDGKSDPYTDALKGEVGTVNVVMKYAGYAEQQQVYDSNLPFVLDILNTMAKEAKEIEKMNAKIKKK